MFKLIFSLFFFTTFTYAFISLDPPVIGEKEGLDAEISLGAKYSSGNSDEKKMSLSVKGEYHAKEWLLYLISSYTYGESNGNKDTNDGLFHLRYVHHILETDYDYELFVQTEFNEFQEIKDRNLIGANIRKKLDLPFDKFYVGVGLFYSYMEPDIISKENPVHKRTKINSYISFVKKINQHFSLTYLGFYQPTLDNISDYRIFQVLQLNTSLSKTLTLSFDINHKYNATPYHDVEKEDIRSSINLKYKFD
ncbi:MAG: DUF481 domain-containing protein [Campylobacterota bacterium]|nr:DUF481 domain-containing protein [Campylobacterota bacterium]